MNWDLIFQIGNFAIGVIGVIGGIGGVIFWRAARKEKEAAAKEKEANAQAAAIEAKQKEADFAESILEKYEKSILARMDSGEMVRKKEFDQLRTDLGGQLSNIQTENRKQNEIIAEQNDLLQDMKEYLNGGFAEFELRKHSKQTKTKKK
jgi:hypothetical protein